MLVAHESSLLRISRDELVPDDRSDRFENRFGGIGDLDRHDLFIVLREDEE
jgi:hypothetical protein